MSDVTDSSGNIVGCTVTGISSGTAVVSVRTKMNLTSSVTVTVNGSGELVEPDPSLGDDFADAALLFCKDNNFYGKTDIWFSIDYREAFGERAWGADFVSSVAKTFGAPTSLIPRSASAGAWSKTTQSQFHSLIADFHTTSSQYDYQAAGLYDPYYVVKRGDIVTLCWKGNTAFSNVGIVSEVDYANRTFSYVIGNVNGTVSVSSPMRFYQAYPGSDSSGDRVIGFFHPNWDELSSWRAAIPAESIFAFIKAMSLDVGDSDTSLRGMLEVKPDNAFCSTVVWSSSDTSVATVDKYSGVVTGAGVGTAVITGRAIADGVTDADGGVQWQAIAYVGIGIPHSGQCGENVFWELSDNCLHIYGSGPMYDYPTIYDSPWNNSHGIFDVYSLVIDEGVDCAGTYSFAGLSSLSFITWPSAIEIHDSAFEACVSMAPLQLPAVSVIGQRAFYQCAFLSSVTIQDGTRIIGDYAFADDAYLNEIHIPASVEYIGDHVFDLNDNGDINPELIIYCDDNSLALEYALSKNISVRTNLGSDFNSFVLPTDTLTIGRRAFGNVPATAVRLPYGVRSIAANAFDMPFIQKIYIPSSVTSIDASAFGGQRSLRIYGMTGSYAETYAGQNGYTFIPLAEEPD